ncbi:DNA replication factor Cdt1 isoform X2 [Centruroides vittatus]|uniref:DNA replication factor Cdt1 isoform X2 n=1 Tax=Centruroides vittatus TaxID=120091 RepID=UPI003510B512
MALLLAGVFSFKMAQAVVTDFYVKSKFKSNGIGKTSKVTSFDKDKERIVTNDSIEEKRVNEVLTPKERHQEQKPKKLKPKNCLPESSLTPIINKEQNIKEGSRPVRKRLLLQDHHLEIQQHEPPPKVLKRDEFQDNSQLNESFSELSSSDTNKVLFDNQNIKGKSEKNQTFQEKTENKTESSSENEKKLTLEEMRTHLSKFSKLVDVQKCLLANYSPKKLHNKTDKLCNGTSNADKTPVTKCPEKKDTATRAEKLKLLKETASRISTKSTELKKIQKKLNQNDELSNKVPAYQKYHNLAAVSTTSLLLPYKYKVLVEIFHCTDMVISLLHNRQETCTFSKLKNSVQEMTKKNFTISHLGQLKTVFPNAYIFQQEKDKNSINSELSHNNYQLSISPNFHYKSDQNLINEDSLPETNNKSLESFKVMNATCLLERRQIFNNRILQFVKDHHKKFLANLNPPILVSSDEILRWHPSFPVDQVPDIAIASLPEPPDVKKYSTAQDVFKLLKDKVTIRVENALQSVIENHKESESVTKPKDTMQKGLLKGVSQALIEKIRAREAARIQKLITRRPEEEKRVEMLTRLPEMILNIMSRIQF